MTDATLHNDPDFQRLGEITETTSFFSIFGRTQRERWHSGFLGWILHPAGTHMLGDKPLKLFVNALCNPTQAAINSHQATRPDALALATDLTRAVAEPNEFSPAETNIAGVGELDCFITGSIDSQKSFAIVVEQKTRSSFHEGQCRAYGDWLLSDERWDIKIPVVLVPHWKLGHDIFDTCQDDRWLAITYDLLLESVLEPLTVTEGLPTKTKAFLEDYITTLRKPVDGRSLVHDNEVTSLIAKLKKKYPTEMTDWLSSSQARYGHSAKVSSNKLYYMQVQLDEDQVVEFDGARQDIFQGAVNLTADNYPLFESAGLVLPYYLDRGTGRSSNRILLSTDKSQVGNVVSAAIDSDRMLYMDSGISGKPHNIRRSLATLFGIVGWEITSFSP